MYQLDDEFKKALGLDAASKEMREQVFAKTAEAVNNRANVKLAESITEAQSAEFEGLAGEDQQKVWDFLNANYPTWESGTEWKIFRENYVGERELTADEFNELAKLFAGAKWISRNAPTYPAMLSEARDEIFDEIIEK